MQNAEIQVIFPATRKGVALWNDNRNIYIDHGIDGRIGAWCYVDNYTRLIEFDSVAEGFDYLLNGNLKVQENVAHEAPSI